MLVKNPNVSHTSVPESRYLSTQLQFTSTFQPFQIRFRNSHSKWHKYSRSKMFSLSKYQQKIRPLQIDNKQHWIFTGHIPKCVLLLAGVISTMDPWCLFIFYVNASSNKSHKRAGIFSSFYCVLLPMQLTMTTIVYSCSSFHSLWSNWQDEFFMWFTKRL